MNGHDTYNLKKAVAVENDFGYTIIEVLFVCGIVVAIALMGMGSYKSQRKFGIEMTCVSKLKQLSQIEESYRDIGDPSVNPDSSYGTFFELQNAGLLPKLFSSEDNDLHDVVPFTPYYKIEIFRSPQEVTLEPSASQYYIVATPIPSTFKLRIFMMQEDGEVYYYLGGLGGQRQVWQ